MKTEGYLLANMNKYKRSLICQLWLGILPLEVEVGRFVNTDYKDQICKMCNQDVENEIHFVLHCSRLEEIRKKWLVKIPELTTLSCDFNKLKCLCSMPYRFGGMLP